MSGAAHPLARPLPWMDSSSKPDCGIVGARKSESRDGLSWQIAL